VNNAPWCAVRKSLFYPPIELHGHRGSAWRVIKYVPLVTDFMGRVYVFVRPFRLSLSMLVIIFSTLLFREKGRDSVAPVGAHAESRDASSTRWAQISLTTHIR
jgi:hypothetical protein